MTRHLLIKLHWLSDCWRRHWHLGGALIIGYAWCFLLTLQPIIADSFNLWAQKQDLSSQILAKEQLAAATQQPIKVSAQVQVRTIHNYQVLKQLLAAAILNNLQLVNLSFYQREQAHNTSLNNNPPAETYYLNLLFTGGFIDLLNLMVKLHNEHLAIEYQQLTLATKQHQLLINIEIVIPAQVISSNDLLNWHKIAFFKSQLRDPWQIILQTHNAGTRYLDQDISSFALNQLRYLGYIASQHHINAILIASNGNTYIVANGALLGQKQWQLQQITTTTLLLKHLKTHDTYVLQRY
jgi:hypothetical protein